jgi:hypothetical protein
MTNPDQEPDVWMRANHRAKPAQSKRHGVFILELAIALTLFAVMGAAVTQMLIARAHAERKLETQARKIQQAHHLLEQLCALPMNELTPEHAESIIDNLTLPFLPDPYLLQSDGSWKVYIVTSTDPLPGVQLVVRFQPSSDAPVSHSPIQLEAWRYDHSAVRKAPHG